MDFFKKQDLQDLDLGSKSTKHVVLTETLNGNPIHSELRPVDNYGDITSQKQKGVEIGKIFKSKVLAYAGIFGIVGNKKIDKTMSREFAPKKLSYAAAMKREDIRAYVDSFYAEHPTTEGIIDISYDVFNEKTGIRKSNQLVDKQIKNKAGEVVETVQVWKQIEENVPLYITRTYNGQPYSPKPNKEGVEVPLKGWEKNVHVQDDLYYLETPKKTSISIPGDLFGTVLTGYKLDAKGEAYGELIPFMVFNSNEAKFLRRVRVQSNGASTISTANTWDKLKNLEIFDVDFSDKVSFSFGLSAEKAIKAISGEKVAILSQEDGFLIIEIEKVWGINRKPRTGSVKQASKASKTDNKVAASFQDVEL